MPVHTATLSPLRRLSLSLYLSLSLSHTHTHTHTPPRAADHATFPSVCVGRPLECPLFVECGPYMCAFLFAGHVTITNYLLNYFPGLDLERRNVFGFTALMKAAMQGRTECIRALMLAGTSPPVPCSPRVPGNAELAPLKNMC